MPSDILTQTKFRIILRQAQTPECPGIGPVCPSNRGLSTHPQSSLETFLSLPCLRPQIYFNTGSYDRMRMFLTKG